MKAFGAIFRFLLNINTIWASMIFIAFFVCLFRHIAHSYTDVPLAALKEGSNTLTISVEDKKKKTDPMVSSTFEVVYADGALRLPEAGPDEDGPRLVKTGDGAKDAIRVWWDYESYGPYTVTVGEAVVSGPKDRIVNLDTFSDTALSTAQVAFELALGFVATFVLFLGLMKVGEDAGLVKIAATVFGPVIRILFPEIPKDHPANGAIIMNITTSVLGLGNACTPFGLKAMEELDKLSTAKGVATNAQVMLLGYNTAGFALLPTTLIAVRTSAGCSNPLEIIGTCMVAGAAATMTGLLLARLLQNLPMFSIQAAAAELAAEQAAQPKAEEEKK